MDPSEPLPRLLRLRGMVARSVPPDGAKLSHSDAHGLADAYKRLREPVRKLTIDLGIEDGATFDAQLPPRDVPEAVYPDPTVLLELASEAGSAAAMLRSLAGYVEGMIENIVLTNDSITMEQIEAAREASRQPPALR